MTTETTTENRATTNKRLVCPSCGTKGRKVGSTTLRALLRAEYRDDIVGDESKTRCDDTIGCNPVDTESVYRFCDSQNCDVVYFAEHTDQRFTQSQLKVAVGAKQSLGERPLCYCFGHSVTTIKDELRSSGNSTALEDIRAKMNDPGCRCETENPSGACCLGSVAKGIKIAQAELGDGDSNEPVDSHDEPTATDSTTGGNRGELIAKVGTLISAVMASACCWLPLLLLAVGVSGAGIAATLEAYRPIFIVVTFGFLAASFYFTYRPRKETASDRDDCCAPRDPINDDCCAPTRKRRFTVNAANKVLLWLVTLLAVVFLLFPNYAGTILGGTERQAVTDEMTKTEIKIEGMTCEGCAVIVEKTIQRVPGVLAVEVDYQRREAIVGTEPGSVFPDAEIRGALKSTGYSTEVVESSHEK